MGWKIPFHPDDMGTTGKRWAHSLKTGDPYTTEYRCKDRHGNWRWMLGRALPMRNTKTGAIEKWYGTCTDIHETVEARFAAKRLVSAYLVAANNANDANDFSDNNSFLSLRMLKSPYSRWIVTEKSLSWKELSSGI